MSSPSQAPRNSYSEAEVRLLMDRTQNLAQQSTRNNRRAELADLQAFAAGSYAEQYRAAEAYRGRVTDIALGSLGMLWLAGQTVFAIGLSVIFPPVGVPLAAVTLGGTIAGGVFFGKDCDKERRINAVKAAHRNLNYRQALMIVERGEIEVSDMAGHRFRYTATQRIQLS